MTFSIKNTLPLWILFFTCSYLHGDETVEEDLYDNPANPQHSKCFFYEKKDCIKIKIVLPEGIEAKDSTLYKINSPDSKGLSVKIKNNKMKCLETYFQLVDIKVHAVPSQEEGGVTFEIIETLEKKQQNSRKIIKEQIVNNCKYLFTTDKQVDFSVFPRLTFSAKFPNTKYLRFFTKP